MNYLNQFRKFPDIQIQTANLFHQFQAKSESTTQVNFLLKIKNLEIFLSNNLLLYPASSCTYKWENNFPENTKTVRNLTYIAPTEFKQPPKHFALSPNWPKENYSPKFVDRSSLLASKGYVPHFNKLMQIKNRNQKNTLI